MAEEKKEIIKAKEHPSYTAFTVLGLSLPIIGIIIGIIFLTKNDLSDRKIGEHTIVMSIIGFVLSFILVGVIFSDNKSSTKSSTTNPGINQSKEAEKPKGKVEVKSDKVKDSGYGSKSVVGEVENITGGGVTYVKVTATFYDKDGKVTDTNETYAGDTPDVALGDGQTTPFEIYISKGTEFDHYKLDVTWN